MKNVVIYHRADFDGIFCREIARKFLPEDTEFIGWDYGDQVPEVPQDCVLYILDLSVPELMGHNGLLWIDHHKTAIDAYSQDIPGYRIDGVAACRLAWQWFTRNGNCPDALPNREQFFTRTVIEPIAVRLAGEYDVWDKRDPDAEVFQFGLRSVELTSHIWRQLLDDTLPNALEGTGNEWTTSWLATNHLLQNGKLLQRYQIECDKSVMQRSFLVAFEGLKFLALNTARCNSLTFAVKDVNETGHDALLGFVWNGKEYAVSLYHAKHRTELDLSEIAKKYGGGGHRGACGFRAQTLPFLPRDLLVEIY